MKPRTYQQGFRDAISRVLAKVRRERKHRVLIEAGVLETWLLALDDRYNRKGKKGPNR